MDKKQLIEKVTAFHIEQFGNPPEGMAWAPGRIEVLGNHTDYNEGTVLSAAIHRGHTFCISRSSQPGIRLFAADADQQATFNLEDQSKVPNIGSGNYVKGVFYFIQEALGERIDGLDCTSFGDVPLGAGLSSSAALEVSAATALLSFLGKSLDLKDVAKICQRAEHEFAGAHCGLLDQFSSLFGREHGLLHSDFRTLEVSGVDLPDDIVFLVVNPRVKHSLSESPYNERRECCEQAATEFAPLLDHPVAALRDVSWEEFQQNKNKINPLAAQRAEHVVGEITRVEKGMGLLQTGDLTAFGELLFQSHQSSIDNFENSCPELNIVVNAARQAGAFGARLSGGGFGGAAIVMVHKSNAQSVGEKIKTLCQAKEIDPDIIEVIPSAGATALA